MNTIKQVIVMRRYYPDNNNPNTVRKLRLGKMIAQGAHASMAFLSNKVKSGLIGQGSELIFSDAEIYWLNGIFTKICVYVDTEEELLEIEKKAKEENVTCFVITDNGQTEFNGVPTKTCLALGPDYSDKIDKIAGNLKLL